MIAQNMKVQPGYSKVILGEAQTDTYTPLPALVEQSWERRVVTEWTFSEAEIKTLKAGGVLRFTQLCFDQPYHPVLLEVKPADERFPLEPVS